ncbi:hypothetical protein J1G42_08850 [Cellulomonas sp. zg-ZUI222]|uniref:hypothetical protein n=1 Tax=Cellulomonas wangleii TaxID=2816956 RepID=UPI001A950B6C|nr:hypothetical protein [Cellulomonas wangleii]MBO0920933.1 hypothetical protein [Cellulomonas wangleii]
MPSPHGRRRSVLARASLVGACLALGGWLVAVVQGVLTYNRLMVMVSARQATELERLLLVIGAVLLVVHLVQRRRWRGVLRAGARGDVTATWLATTAALGAAWYGIAVVQWYLVVRLASTGPQDLTRDPTVLEHLLLTGAGIALVALAVRRVSGRASEVA